jgi:hypothetical protein
MRSTRRHVEQSTRIAARPEAVWREVTDVDIASFRHPPYLAALGIPKPLRAEVVRSGVGGARVAYFSNGLRFSQEITAWEPCAHYAFTFKPDPGFRVAYLLDLADGPFRMVSGAYRLAPVEGGTVLSLSSDYELRGLAGALLGVPVRLVLRLFQAYLLRGLGQNAVRRERRPA